MSVHYKFKNTINYEAVKFDGVYISASDLKSIIVQQKKCNHSELQFENEETGEQYADDQLIPKNTNIIVIRAPPSSKRTRLSANQPYPTRFSGNANSAGTTVGNNHQSNNNHHHHHHHHGHHHHHNSNNRHAANLASNLSSSSSGIKNHPSGAPKTAQSTNSNSQDGASGAREAMELVSTKPMTEEERIKYIQSQSTKDFDPIYHARGGRGGGMGARGGGAGGPRHGHYIHPNYTCRKCGIPGHYISDCKTNAMHKVKRSSGIPRDFLVKVDSKEKGALMTPSGEYAVPYIDRDAYNNPKIEKAPFFEDTPTSDEAKPATAATTTSTATIT